MDTQLRRQIDQIDTLMNRLDTDITALKRAVMTTRFDPQVKGRVMTLHSKSETISAKLLFILTLPRD